MPDTRRHRGPHPEDPTLFAPERRAALRAATRDLEWLLERGYPPGAALKLVGDRWGLDARQREGVGRSACPPSALVARRAREVPDARLDGATLWIDGFNVLTTIEVALSGGVVLIGRDRAARDLAGVHGTYRRVVETEPALACIHATLTQWGVASVRWLLDRPVSNSGRLRGTIESFATDRNVSWDVVLEDDPDRRLRTHDGVIASADRHVLDGCAWWVSLARTVVQTQVPDAFVVDLA